MKHPRPLLLLLLVALLTNLHRPPVQWDESWTILTAETWRETGHYGVLNAGQPEGTHGGAAFPPVLAIVASYSAFGPSLWAARLPGLQFGLAALALLWHLARRMFDHDTADIAVLLACAGYLCADLMPLLNFRLVLAESVMLFALLAGYALLVPGRLWLAMPAGAYVGLALVAKAQPLPFVACSWLAMLAIAARQRQWKYAALLLLAGAVAGAVWWWLPGVVYGAVGAVRDGTSGQLPAIALVLTSWQHRLHALAQALVFGGPLLLAAWHWPRRGVLGIVDTGLLVMALAWLAWFGLCSAGLTRHLLPAMFIGSIFVAQMLPRYQARVAGLLRAGATVAVLVHLVNLAHGSNDAQQVAAWLSERPGQVETLEGPVVWAVGGHRAHHPPTQLHVDLQRQTVGLPHVGQKYEPPAARWLVTTDYSEQVYNLRDWEPVRNVGRFTVWSNVKPTVGH
jgi:4-amino-4-deoxy-L-arabinose transferase-like glycosyltransferase